MPSPCFVLIHSPLVGPFTWQPVAEALRQKGVEAIVPSLSGMQPGGEPFSRKYPGMMWQQAVERIRTAVEAAHPAYALVIVVHSGAGALLPAVRQAVTHPVAGYLFVDARLPREGASFFGEAPQELTHALRAMEVDGWLPPWSEWFGEEAVAEILPDETVRRRFLADLRPVPVAYLEEPTPVFPGWPDAPCAYIQLSPAYDPEAQAARASGWRVETLEAGHLHMLVDPHGVAEKILELTPG